MTKYAMYFWVLDSKSGFATCSEMDRLLGISVAQSPCLCNEVTEAPHGGCEDGRNAVQTWCSARQVTLSGFNTQLKTEIDLFKKKYRMNSRTLWEYMHTFYLCCGWVKAWIMNYVLINGSAQTRGWGKFNGGPGLSLAVTMQSPCWNKARVHRDRIKIAGL